MGNPGWPAILHALVLAICTLFIPLIVADEPPPAPEEKGQIREGPPARIGQIIIVGNEKTPDTTIRKVLDLYPGEILKYPALQQAERKLAELNVFVSDRKTGVRPTITVLDDPNNATPFRDLLVQVKEK